MRRWVTGPCRLALRAACVACAAASPIFASALAQDLAQEIYERIAGHSGDRFGITVSRTIDGRETMHSEFESAYSDFELHWRWDASTVSLSVVSMSYASDSSIRSELAYWPARLDEMRASREQMLAFSGPVSSALADPALEAAYEAIGRHADDIELLFRVLTGLERFAVLSEPLPGREGPLSDLPRVSAGPAFYSNKHVNVAANGAIDTSEGAGQTAAYTLNPVSWQFGENDAVAEAAGLEPKAIHWAIENTHPIDLLLWRYDPGDMARVTELVANLDAIAASMHWDAPDIDDPAMQVAVDGLAHNHNLAFERTFVRAVTEIVRYAWHLSPQEPPAGFWSRVDPMTGSEIPQYEGQPENPMIVLHVSADATLTLPDMPGDRVAMLRLPVDGLYADQPSGPPAIEGSDSRAYRPSVVGQQWPRLSVRTVEVNDPAREWHRFGGEIVGPHAFSTVAIAGSGTLEGGFTLTYRYLNETVVNDGAGIQREDNEEIVRVSYSIAAEGTEQKDYEIPMTLSIAHPVNGEIAPLAEPLQYGDAFYIEGLLEMPATRSVYGVTVALGDVEDTIFLRPVEQGSLILRSELLYLIWDVPAERAGVPLPARLRP